MNLGPVMLDVAGCKLLPEERDLLHHPLCGGVILFARNFEHIDQLRALTSAIRDLREPALLIAVDQEGGRVQRFREGFLPLPALRLLGERFDTAPGDALHQADRYGWLMASECLAAGVDFSFAPVLDLDYGASTVIGDRAFHGEPRATAALAAAYMRGMHRAGMSAVGKHFPGHGFVRADSHTDLPVDERELAQIEARDLEPFRELVRQGLEGIMPAHVIYSACDSLPAGFSPFWLKHILRDRLGFGGVIFSDDLSMAAAHSAGTPAERARAAREAGCDMLLVCNDQAAAGEVLESLEKRSQPEPGFERMRGNPGYGWATLHAGAEWKNTLNSVG